MSDPVYISLREAAERYSCSTRTLRRYIAAGRLPAVHAPTRMIRVREDHLATLFGPKEGLVGTTPAAEPAAEPADEPAAEPADEPAAEPAAEPVDLAHLRARARAYIVGLEASLKRLRTENDELRAKLNDPAPIDERRIKAAYRRGWRDASEATFDAAESAVRSLTDLRKSTVDAWMTSEPAPKGDSHE